MKRLLYLLGFILGFITPIVNIYTSTILYIYTGFKSYKLKKFGLGSRIKPTMRMLIGAKYIEVGNNSLIGQNVQLTAYNRYQDTKFNPSIIIGDNSVIGDGSHITAISKIIIGNNVLMGRNVLITDNSHGKYSLEELNIPPLDRPLHSKGAVIIEDNVWIGEKASIMPGVTIGTGSIIGANAVITKHIPPYSMAVGNPAKIIKTLNH